MATAKDARPEGRVSGVGNHNPGLGDEPCLGHEALGILRPNWTLSEKINYRLTAPGSKILCQVKHLKVGERSELIY